MLATMHIAENVSIENMLRMKATNKQQNIYIDHNLFYATYDDKVTTIASFIL